MATNLSHRQLNSNHLFLSKCDINLFLTSSIKFYLELEYIKFYLQILLLDAAEGLVLSSGNPIQSNLHAEIWSLLATFWKPSSAKWILPQK